MCCRPSTALRCKRLWPNGAADALAHRGHFPMAANPRKSRPNKIAIALSDRRPTVSKMQSGHQGGTRA